LEVSVLCEFLSTTITFAQIEHNYVEPLSYCSSFDDRLEQSASKQNFIGSRASGMRGGLDVGMRRYYCHVRDGFGSLDLDVLDITADRAVLAGSLASRTTASASLVTILWYFATQA
jgi:hypothetical protein